MYKHHTDGLLTACVGNKVNINSVLLRTVSSSDQSDLFYIARLQTL